MSDETDPLRTNDRRVIWLMLLGLLLLFGGLYVAGYLFTGDRLPTNTSVSGVQIGGLTPAAARTRLTDALAPRTTTPIVVTAGGHRLSLDPSRAGLGVDVAASVDHAGAGRSWRPSRMWDYFTGGSSRSAVLLFDRAALTRAVASFARQVDRPAKEGAITFAGGSFRRSYPHDGTALDTSAAVAAIRAAFVEHRTHVRLHTAPVPAAISSHDVDAAVNDFANPAVSGPVVIVLGGENVVLRPQDFDAALTMVDRGGRLVPHLRDARLLALIAPKLQHIAVAPRNARVRLVDGRPRVIHGRPGVVVRPRQVTDHFLGLLTRHGSGRTLRVRSLVRRPQVTTADARRLGITGRVSGFTTYFPYAAYRNINIGRAAQLINGTVLKPGDTFSMNKTLGQRTYANGFTKGYVIADGVYAKELGGGVSQATTTTFNAAFFAGLKDVEHQAHSFYIDRYPVGREATVVWPSIDLKFQDDTPYGVLIQAWIDKSTPHHGGAMHVRMWSTKYWDITTSTSQRYDRTAPVTRHLSGPGCVPNHGYDGFDIDVYRYFRRHGSTTLDHKETMHTHYLPSDSVICS